MSRTDNTSPEIRTERIDVVSNSHGARPWFRKLKKHRERKLRIRANQAARSILANVHRLNEATDFDIHPEVESFSKTRLRTREQRVLA